MTATGKLYVGLMSGTSVDGIDAALVQFDDTALQLVATHEHPMPDALRDSVVELSSPGKDSIHRAATIDQLLGHAFADAALAVLAKEGVAPEGVCAIGSHGQTVRHAPPKEGIGYTVQLGDPNLIAERTGITTVADFRRRDMASGGQGAPLAPAFHAAHFAKPGVRRSIVNIGGIANATVLDGERLVEGFDSGPGNTLLDNWYALHHAGRYDDNGNWAASGRPQADLLHSLLADPYFQRSGPRSTGKELFNSEWLQSHLVSHPSVDPADVQATLAELTAISIARAAQAASTSAAELFVCGGGAHNTHVMRRLDALLPNTAVATTDSLGLSPDWVEAVAFAWLAHRCVEGKTGNEPAVTGASGHRILGGIYQA